MSRRRKLRLLALALGLAVVAPASRAFAHAVGVSSGEYRLSGNVVEGDLGMADRELARLVPAVDTDGDGSVSAGELAAGEAVVSRAIAAGLIVTADDRPCPGGLTRAWVSEGDGGAVFQVRYTCPAAPGRLTLALPMLDGMAPGHRHLARLFSGGQAHVQVLDHAHAVWTVGGASSAARLAWSMLKMGVEHILTGADHLVFLLGLLLVGGGWRPLLGVVTAFTVAHSITLALAALSIFTPSARLVEPAIALSIAYVGIENLFAPDPRHRWRITFAFGLIHGFGFAAALRAIALPRPQIPLALLSFNAGVELGQLAVLAVALPLTTAARRAAWFGPRGVRALSVAIAIGGGALFVTRLFAR
ncbi:MAG TPA: HupE/UreJ family protein [Polyangia bacterium]|nr:HupE/UreJ family protein [Polyangia bacterium]